MLKVNNKKVRRNEIIQPHFFLHGDLFTKGVSKFNVPGLHGINRNSFYVTMGTKSSCDVHPDNPEIRWVNKEPVPFSKADPLLAEYDLLIRKEKAGITKDMEGLLSVIKKLSDKYNI